MLTLPWLIHAEQVNVVTVNTLDNQKIHWLATSRPDCYFADDAVTLRFMTYDPPIEIGYPMENFKSISYGREDSAVLSGLDQVVAQDPVFEVTSDEIIARRLPSNSSVTVFSVAGVIEAAVTTDDDGECVVSTASLPAGTHIIKTIPTTYKFIKR